MFWSKDSIVEKIRDIPTTLEDISVDIFGGVTTKNTYLHRVALSGKDDPDAPYVCRGLYKDVKIEQELMYPCIDSSLPDKYSFHPTACRFMVPYELSGEGEALASGLTSTPISTPISTPSSTPISTLASAASPLPIPERKCRAFDPRELETRFPLAYSRILEFRSQFHHMAGELTSSDYYSLQGQKALEYLNTPKLVITERYEMQAGFDTSGAHIFEEGCGIVLQDPEKYPYVLAVLNSSIARTLPEILRREKLYVSTLTPAALKRFPIVFPENELTEKLVSQLSRYLIYIHRQLYSKACTDSREFRELVCFYERLINLLLLDTYITKDLGPEFPEILENHLPFFEGAFEYENGGEMMIELQAVKQKLLAAPEFRKCRFSSEFTNILATLNNNGIW